MKISWASFIKCMYDKTHKRMDLILNTMDEGNEKQSLFIKAESDTKKWSYAYTDWRAWVQTI